MKVETIEKLNTYKSTYYSTYFDSLKTLSELTTKAEIELLYNHLGLNKPEIKLFNNAIEYQVFVNNYNLSKSVDKQIWNYFLTEISKPFRETLQTIFTENEHLHLISWFNQKIMQPLIEFDESVCIHVKSQLIQNQRIVLFNNNLNFKYFAFSFLEKMLLETQLIEAEISSYQNKGFMPIFWSNAFENLFVYCTFPQKTDILP